MRSRLALLAPALLLLAMVASLAHGQAGPECRTIRFLGYHMAAPGSATNIISKDATGATINGLVARDNVAKFAVTVQVATSSVVDVVATDGTTSTTMHLNSGTALSAGCLYEFDVPATNFKPFQDQNPSPSALKWNVQVETDGVIDLLEVIEVNTGS